MPFLSSLLLSGTRKTLCCCGGKGSGVVVGCGGGQWLTAVAVTRLEADGI
jgi:hypothetical protein